jgi:hypothetical protein
MSILSKLTRGVAPKVAAALLVGVGLFTFSAPSDAGGLVAVALYKPDLRIAHMGPSLVGYDYVRLVVGNAGNAPSKPCWIKVNAGGSNPSSNYYWFWAVEPGQYWGIDVWMPTSISQYPGQVSQAIVDLTNLVAEKNETNNVRNYISPPH